MSTPLAYAQTHQKEHLAELVTFFCVSPVLALQPEHAADVRAAAEWLADSLKKRPAWKMCVSSRSAGHPLVYADWLHAGETAPTVLIYGHYDVQPAEPPLSFGRRPL
ncbi:MAG: hypothetical protein M5U34_01075 [Chloroflexi bacterium]|nr:hypothetical protein [Chloroflexota bacterium]